MSGPMSGSATVDDMRAGDVGAPTDDAELQVTSGLGVPAIERPETRRPVTAHTLKTTPPAARTASCFDADGCSADGWRLGRRMAAIGSNLPRVGQFEIAASTVLASATVAVSD